MIARSLGRWLRSDWATSVKQGSLPRSHLPRRWHATAFLNQLTHRALLPDWLQIGSLREAWRPSPEGHLPRSNQLIRYIIDLEEKETSRWIIHLV
jgi:hypothetical protein